MLTYQQRNGYIATYARQRDDVMRMRIGLSNQIDRLVERHGADDAFALLLSGAIAQQQDAIVAAEHTLERQIVQHARQHFMAPWIEQARGISLLGFGLVLGVVGDLDLFPNVAKLWKYMGQSVGDDGRAPHRIRGEKFTKTTPEKQGNAYSPRGRALCHQLGEALVRATGGVSVNGAQRTVSPYRLLYDEKKAAYQARERRGPSECPFSLADGTPQVHRDKTGKVLKCGDAHIHKAAMRYAVKCLLRDLWVAWQQLRPEPTKN